MYFKMGSSAVGKLHVYARIHFKVLKNLYLIMNIFFSPDCICFSLSGNWSFFTRHQAQCASVYLFCRDEGGVVYPQASTWNSEASIFSFCFAKKPFSLGKVICASQFPCPHPIKGKIAEILKKAPGNIAIPESLGSYKNKQITESIG